MNKKYEKLRNAISNKKVPIVILDNKWHKIFTNVEKSESIILKEERLNELIRMQGKLNTETRNLRLLKKKLMNEIVSSIGDTKVAEENGRLVEDCNRKLEEYKEQMEDLPLEIDIVNKEIMLETCEAVYDLIHDNEKEIKELTDWVNNIRVQLKTNLVKKQEMEIQNALVYSYMHDVFGMDSMDIFDLEESPINRLEKLRDSKNESSD